MLQIFFHHEKSPPRLVWMGWNGEVGLGLYLQSGKRDIDLSLSCQKTDCFAEKSSHHEKSRSVKLFFSHMFEERDTFFTSKSTKGKRITSLIVCVCVCHDYVPWPC